MSTSVLIPAYNDEDVISDALGSVLRQTRSPDQIIVVDDGSKDGTADVVTRWARKNGVAVELVRKVNGGPSSARNAGFRRVTTDYVALLDSDDLWDRNHLEELEHCVALRPEAVLWFGATEMIREEDGEVVRQFPGQSLNGAWESFSEGYWASTGPQLYCSLLRGSYIGVSSVLLSRRALESIGPMDETMLMSEDLDYWLRLSRIGAFVHIPNVISFKRVNGNNLTVPRNSFQINHGIFRALRKSLRNSEMLGLSAEESHWTARAMRNAVPDLLYSASEKGLKQYCETWLEVISSGVIQETLKPRQLLRAVASSAIGRANNGVLGAIR